MSDKHHVLPTKEPKKHDEESVLHLGYIIGLLPPGVDINKPYYRGDIYEDNPTSVAREWQKET